MLHNCPWARLRPLLQGTRWGDALGTRALRGRGAHPCGVPVWGCVCVCGTVHPLLEFCVPVQGSVYPSGVVNAVQGLRVHIWGCACLFGVVHACILLCLPIWDCACQTGIYECLSRVVSACLGLYMPLQDSESRIVHVSMGL